MIALCCIFAAARAAISWFPMDAPGTERTDTGRHHGQLAVCAFVGVAIAAATLSRALGHHHVDGRFEEVSAVLAAIMLDALVAMARDRRASGDHYGLAERVFYLGMTAWLVFIAILVAVA